MEWLLILIPIGGYFIVKAIAKDFIAPIHSRLDDIEDRLRDLERDK